MACLPIAASPFRCRSTERVLRMIRLATGNLLEAKAGAQVNTVSTVGIMRKGIALMFRQAFEESFRVYAAACRQGEVRSGYMFVTEHTGPATPQTGIRLRLHLIRAMPIMVQ